VRDLPATAARPAMQSCCWAQMRSTREHGPSAVTALTGDAPFIMSTLRCTATMPKKYIHRNIFEGVAAEAWPCNLAGSAAF
jgi:hypothetical protein